MAVQSEKPEYVDELSDPRMSLTEWADTIQKLIGKYGPNAVMSTDAGYNNVSFVVEKGNEDNH